MTNEECLGSLRNHAASTMIVLDVLPADCELVQERMALDRTMPPVHVEIGTLHVAFRTAVLDLINAVRDDVHEAVLQHALHLAATTLTGHLDFCTVRQGLLELVAMRTHTRDAFLAPVPAESAVREQGKRVVFLWWQARQRLLQAADRAAEAVKQAELDMLHTPKETP